MPSLDALTGTGTYAKELGGTQAAPAAFVEATVATTPSSVDDEVMVLVGAEASQLQAGPCRWQPRPVDGGLLFPTRGDACLIVTGDSGHRAIVWWKPATPPISGGWTTGDLKVTAKAVPDAGWLLCDGTSYLRTDQPDLFAALGGASSPWGLPDGSHFKVPDLRGRAAIGAGTATGAAGATAHALGTTGGEETHILSVGEMPAHAHPGSAATTGTIAVPTAAPTANVSSAGANALAIGLTIASQGGGGAHNTMPPFATVNYMIKI